MEKLNEIDKNILLVAFGLNQFLINHPELVKTTSGNIEIDSENLLKAFMKKENMDKDFELLNMDAFKKYLNYLTNQQHGTTEIPEYCPLKREKSPS